MSDPSNNFVVIDPLQCPITGETFKDPVIDPEGNTYERSAILEWLLANSTSPITRTPLTPIQLTPNRALLDQITNLNFTPPPVPTTSEESEEKKDDSTPPISPTFLTTLTPSTLPLSTPTSLLSLTLTPPTSTSSSRQSVHLILCIDVSGSMSSPATLKSSEEDAGLSILDITKHAAKTAIKLLNENDVLSIVKFTGTATVLQDTIKMSTPSNKQLCINSIESLQPENSTNLWDGLQKSMDLVASKKTLLPASIFLLTDGVPNMIPPRGHVPMLERYLDANPTLNFTVNTFGFGYNLDSDLLRSLAVSGSGNYSFIPDASFVGTVFVHALSAEFVKYASKAVIKVETEYEGNVLGSYGNKQLVTKKTSWGYEIDVGTLSFDQSTNYVIAFPDSDVTVDSATLTYIDFKSHNNVSITSTTALTVDHENIDFNVMRLRTVDVVSKLTADALDTRVSNDKISELETLVAKLEELGGSDKSKIIHPLTVDVSGQITEAFSKEEYFQKWGRHYLPAITRAHLLQVCTNFKDPGLQVYGGPLFETLRSAGDDIFMSMPPPKPSRRDQHGRFRQQMSSAGFSRSYYNASNGCFAPLCTVQLQNGTLKYLKDVVKNDVVLGTDNKIVTIDAIVKTLTEGGRCEMVTLPSGTCSTPYHPVFVNNKWAFPKDLAPTVEIDCPAVYSFVTTGGTGVLINGVEGISLGHGIANDPVASHPYFGTSKIIDDLKRFSTYDAGLVVFNYGCMKRLEENNTDTLIMGFHEERYLPLGVRTE
ncbi:hypothetical protein TrLO_g11968 [Triparma laevis f. longispina]|uniref:U-box domain-containing protein n=1 Tax=Triparma laevis f. longispina TaxID=1714387 RepID=A0A9W7KYY0_9STRA|nr:hypothetical protein TrLO_g11968 [Triparma laevis f. longispina]